MGPIPQATGRTSFVCLYYTKSLAIKFYSQLKQFCLRHFNSTTSGQTTDVNSTLNKFTRHILWPHFQTRQHCWSVLSTHFINAANRSSVSLPHHISTDSHRLMTIILSNLNRFQKLFTGRFFGKFVVKWLLKSHRTLHMGTSLLSHIPAVYGCPVTRVFDVHQNFSLDKFCSTVMGWGLGRGLAPLKENKTNFTQSAAMVVEVVSCTGRGGGWVPYSHPKKQGHHHLKCCCCCCASLRSCEHPVATHKEHPKLCSFTVKVQHG